ncbi:Hypothetical protein A7982_02886 [Minicystis rosea]|nr:Hypothetical protein A7982_02886 [Minicystis rosea]
MPFVQCAGSPEEDDDTLELDVAPPVPPAPPVLELLVTALLLLVTVAPPPVLALLELEAAPPSPLPGPKVPLVENPHAAATLKATIPAAARWRVEVMSSVSPEQTGHVT